MFALLSAEERAFLRAILNDPAELTTWLVYADWLDEHADPRAEFIRLEIRREQLPDSDPQRVTIRARLEELRPAFDPDWVAVFDRPLVENCSPATNFRCPRRWELLRATECPGVRHCGVCEKAVYYCHDLDTARAHVKQGDCISVRLGVPRLPTDLILDEVEAQAWESLFADPRFVLHKDQPT